MNIFKAELITDSAAISIISNTTWEAFAIGNFKLSKYYGKGNDSIDIIIPDDIYLAEGYVYFKYGDEKCIYPNLYATITNKCFTKTIPNYTICDVNGEKRKTIFLYYNDDKEILELQFSPNMKEWSIADNRFLIFNTLENKLIIVSDGNDGEIEIKIGQEDSYCDSLFVKIVKNPNL